MKLDDHLKALGSVPFGHGTLLPLLAEYKRPNDKIARWLLTGELVQLRKGLYLLGSSWRTAPVSRPLVANVLFGPSYVSLEFALSTHGLIPEGTVDLTSVTPRRGRQVVTPFGHFSYTHLPLPLYGVDVRMESNPDGTSFLLASPTQAICDKVVLTRHLQACSINKMRVFLFEDLRMEPEAVSVLDMSVIEQCISAGYKTRQLRALHDCVGAMQ